jgi:hypothetical protein
MGINTFFQKLTPKEKKFYPMFEQSATYTLEAANLLREVFSIKDEPRREELFRTIKELEVKGDEVAHQIFDELDRTFITPFDREDIHQLTSTMDDVMDFINGASQRTALYKPKSFPAGFLTFSEIIIKGAEEILKSVRELKNLKKGVVIAQSIIRINELENEGDDLYHKMISDLFQTEKDAIELIKVKEILQTLERGTDRIEDVADVLKTIMIKVA